MEKYRALSPAGRQTIHTLLDALCRMQGEPARTIPLYRSPAAAGAAAPVPGLDYELLTVTGDVPPAAELAVRMEGDSMAPYIPSGSVIYIHHAPLANGDVGLFCIGGAMLVRQYTRGEGGAVRLLPLNRTAGEVLTFPTGGRFRPDVLRPRAAAHAPPPGKRDVNRRLTDFHPPVGGVCDPAVVSWGQQERKEPGI